MANTANRGYPKPVSSNFVSDDVLLLQAALDLVDGDVEALFAALAGKASTAHQHAIGDVQNLQVALDGKAATNHAHALDDLSDVEGAAGGATGYLLARQANGQWGPLAPAAALGAHQHVIGDVQNLQTALDGKAATSYVDGLIAALKGGVSAAYDTLAELAAGLATKLTAASNLADVADAVAARANLGLAIGSAADVRAKTANKALNTDGVFGAAVPPALAAWTGTVAVNFDTFLSSAKVSITGNTTLGVTSNVAKGTSGAFEVTQSGGPWTLSLNATYWVTGDGKGITLGAGLNVVSWLALDNGKVFLALGGKAVA